jgi:hypothetical protein
MTAGKSAFDVTPPIPDAMEAELAELSLLRQRFRNHHIFRHVLRDRGVRFIAHRAAAGVRPHTVITGDLAELRDELERASHEFRT